MKKVAAIAFIALLAHLLIEPAAASSKEKNQAEKVRANILKLGSGPNARVKIKLRDKTRMEGYISEAQQDSFTIIDAKTGQTTVIVYSTVAKVSGKNVLTGVKIAKDLAATALMVTLVVLFIRAANVD
jgi:hypothetical protein